MIRSSRVRASVSRFAASALVAFLLAAALPCAAAKKQKAPPARAVKSDLKYVRCQVCEEVAKVLSREASTLREEKGAKLTEADVLEKVEKVCDVETVEGEWLLKHDLVEKGDALAIGAHGRGRLRQVQLRVQDDAARVREDRRRPRHGRRRGALHRRRGDEARRRDPVPVPRRGRNSARRVPQETPKLPKDRPAGPKFEPVDKKDIDMQRMMKTMRDAGMGGMQMYGRDDMDAMMSGDYDDGDEDGGGGRLQPRRVRRLRRRRGRPRAQSDGKARRRGCDAEGGGRERLARRRKSRSGRLVHHHIRRVLAGAARAEDEYEL